MEFLSYVALACVLVTIPYSLQDCPRPTDDLDPNAIIDPDSPVYPTWFSYTASCHAGFTGIGPTSFHCYDGLPDYWDPDPSSFVCIPIADGTTTGPISTDLPADPNTTPGMPPIPLTTPDMPPIPLTTPDMPPIPLTIPDLPPSPLTTPDLPPIPLTTPDMPPIPLTTQGSTAPVIEVICDSISMTILVAKGLIGNNTEVSDVHFDDESCAAYDHNPSYIALYTTYDKCLTKTQETNSSFIYSNTVTYSTPNTIGSSDITREASKEIAVRCELDRRQHLDSSFVPRIGVTLFDEAGYGNYSLSLERYTDQTFNQPVVDTGAEVTLGEPLYFAVDLTSIPGLIVFIENCWATPSPSPNSTNSYTFLDNGCALDPTMQILSSFNSSFQTFTIDAFALFEENSQVFIHCEAFVCDDGPSSRCAQGCLSRVRRGGRQTRGASSIPRLLSNGPLSSHKNGQMAVQDQGDSGKSSLGSSPLLFDFLKRSHSGYGRLDDIENDIDE